jgi:hypothetical protein
VVCRPNTALANTQCGSYRQQQSAVVEAPADQRVISSSASATLLTESNAQQHTFRCVATIVFDRLITGPNQACGCAITRYRSCDHATASQQRVVTAPSLTMSEVRAAHDPTPIGQLSRAQINPVCSTAENVVAPEPKLTRLLASLADPAIAPAGGDLFADIVRRLKISYELLGHELPADSALHGQLLQVYRQHPAITPSCGRDVEDDYAACDAETDWRLRFCTRLTGGHVDADLVAGRFDDCIEELNALGAAVESGACTEASPALAQSVTTHRRLMDRVLVRFALALAASPPGTGERPIPLYDEAAIVDALRRIETWFPAARLGLGDRVAHRELELAANKFWQAAHGYAPGATTTTWLDDSMYAELQAELDAAAEEDDEDVARQAVEDAMELTQLRGLALDRAVLMAAYRDIGPAPVLTGAPLLRITSDALAPLQERLDALVQFHDVGCAVANCATMSTPTTLSQFWNILSQLTSPSLADAMADPRVGELNGWRPVFARIAAHQTRLEEAVEEAHLEDARREQDFIELVTAAQSRTATYDATGLFLPPTGDRLLTGVHVNQRDRVKEHVLSLKRDIEDGRNELEGGLTSLVNNLTRVNDAESAQAQLVAAKERVASEIADLTKREGSFRTLIRSGSPAGNDEFETLMADWAKVSGSIDEAAYLRVASTREFRLAGDDANFVDWDTQGILDVAAKDTAGVDKIALQAGQVLSLATNGAWSPTCAVRSVHMIDPDHAIEAVDDPGVAGVRIQAASAPIGPEGYTIQWTGSGYSAASTHAGLEGRLTVGVKAEACGGIKIGGTGGNSCGYVDASITASVGKNWQGGREGRTSATFSSGLFLPQTPFEAPAGALVVVEMPEGETDPALIRDVHLVRAPHTSIVVNEAADLYLVPNDTSCRDEDSTNEMVVTVGQYTTVGAAADALVARMAHTMSVMRSGRQGFVDRGEMLPSEVSALELEAKGAQIGEPGSLQIPVDEYPPAMRDLFYKYVAREITSLTASVRLAAIERELAVKVSEYRAILLALHNSKKTGYLVSLLPKWTVRGMKLKELREVSTAYASSVRYALKPILEVWYPGVLAELSNTDDVMRLTSVDADTPIKDMTDLLLDFADELDRQMTDADYLYPAPEDTAPVFVTLRFPKPSELHASCADAPSARCRRSTDISTYRWATVSQTRALWQSLGQPTDGGATRRLVFTVGPEDLYEAMAGSEYLPCTKALPVVRKLGIALTGYASNGVPAEHRGVEGWIGEHTAMSFAGADGVHDLYMDNGTWRQLSDVPLVYGSNDYTAIKARFDAIPQDVRGVSPFTTFEFEIPESTVAEWRLRDAKTIDLVMQVEAVRAPAAVAVPICERLTQSSLALDDVEAASELQ